MRHGILFAFIIIASVAVGGLLYLYGGSAFHTTNRITTEKGMGYSVLAEGSNAAVIDTRENFRITNTTDFETLWKIVYGQTGPVVPIIDFDTNEVLAVFDGSHSTGGYKVSVRSVKDVDGQRVIDILRTSPGDACTPASAPSNPFVFVQISKTALPVTHTEETEVSTCN